MSARALYCGAAGLCVATAACMGPHEDAGADSGPANSEDVANVEVALSAIPTGVLCVKVTTTVSGQAVTTPLLTVSSGQSSTSLSLGQLPLGAAAFTGSAYAVACASVTTATQAAWITDPVTTTLAAGTVTVVPLTFRKINPVTVSANFDSLANISVGSGTTFAVMTDGTVKSLGWTGSPVLPQSVSQVTIGNGWQCARGAGRLWCWGYNANGVLGPSVALGATQNTPVEVTGAFNFTDISAGDSHVCVTVSSVNTFCWGANGSGQIGNGTLTNSAIPVQLTNYASIVAGSNHTCAISPDGTLACWGANTFGQTGKGSTSTAEPYPLAIALNDVARIALGADSTCAMRADGTIRCWGSGESGQLGNGTTTAKLVPTQVTGLTDAVDIVAGFHHYCARRLGGLVSCWGRGPMLGNGVGDDSSVPVQVPGLTNVAQIRAHLSSHTCAELTDRSVKCWGSNLYGTIGDGTVTFASLPTLAKLP